MNERLNLEILTSVLVAAGREVKVGAHSISIEGWRSDAGPDEVGVEPITVEISRSGLIYFADSERRKLCCYHLLTRPPEFVPGHGGDADADTP